MLLDQQNTGQAVRVQSDARVVEQLRSHPGLADDVKVDRDKEVPLDPETLDLYLAFLVFARS